MKKWSDEECEALVREHYHEWPITPKKIFAMIRAAVEEARREEREACANLCRVSMYGASLATAPPSLEAMNFAQKWGEQVADTIAAAILARDKEPRDAER